MKDKMHRRRESSQVTITGQGSTSPTKEQPSPTSPLSESSDPTPAPAPASPPPSWKSREPNVAVRSATHGLPTTNSTFRGGFGDVQSSNAAKTATIGEHTASPSPVSAPTPWDGQRVSIRLRPELQGFVFKHNAYDVRRTAVLPVSSSAAESTSVMGMGSCSSDALLDQARRQRRVSPTSRATAASLTSSSALSAPAGPSSPTSSVIRRYSDFLWLHSLLLSRWPLRLIPPLPPKRLGMPLVAGVAGTGALGSGDDAFIQRRVKGLQRYLSALMSHPVLAHDKHLAVFLSEKGSIADWRASHPDPVIVEETLDPRPPSNLASISSLRSSPSTSPPKGFDDVVGGKSLDALTNKVVPELLDRWTNLANVVERMARRCEAQGRDGEVLADLVEGVAVERRGGGSWAWLGGAKQRGADEGRDEEVGTPTITRRIAALHRDLSSLSQLRADQVLGGRDHEGEDAQSDRQSFATTPSSSSSSNGHGHAHTPLLERFKTLRDLFLSMRSLLARHATLTKQLDDELAALKARIKAGTARLESLRLGTTAGGGGGGNVATSAEAAREEATKLHETLRRDAGRMEELSVRRERARRALWDEVGLVRARCSERAVAAVWAGEGAMMQGEGRGESSSSSSSSSAWLEDERRLRGAERLAVEECWRELGR